MKALTIFDPEIAYSSIDDKNIFSFIELIRSGIQFKLFKSFASQSPFSLNEWSNFLHISERTMQRYEKEKRKFDALQSEKIIEIALLFKKGKEVFGNSENFNTWLESENLALGKIKPKSLLDSSFGLDLLKDELTRVEHGVLA